MIYQALAAEEPLSQGDVIDGCPIFDVQEVEAVRDQVRRGLVHGWYYLPAAPALIELPESIVDLRDLHRVSRGVLENRVAAGKRLCRLATPYREHLAQHFGVTYMRIGLPEPYETQA